VVGNRLGAPLHSRRMDQGTTPALPCSPVHAMVVED
jgi:hypothetical protein